LRRRRGAAERLRDAVRIDDHDHRAVAEDRRAGKAAMCRSFDDIGLITISSVWKHAVDDDAEDLAADLRHHDEAVVAFAFAELQDFLEMNERQQLVAQPQHRRVLDPLDAVLAAGRRRAPVRARKAAGWRSARRPPRRSAPKRSPASAES
jgi:hypothetical protein